MVMRRAYNVVMDCLRDDRDKEETIDRVGPTYPRLNYEVSTVYNVCVHCSTVDAT